MDLRIFTEPQQGAGDADLVAVARTAEQCGFGAFFRSDHYLAMDVEGLPGPTDAWVSLGVIAGQTRRIRLGTLVSPATFRLPGPLAIQVAEVDHVSGGRVELGLGAGWFEAEHRAYGIPFPPVAERFDRLEEQLEIVTGLWSTPAGGRYSFSGKHYTLSESPALPKPVQSRIPLIMGGMGASRTPDLAARYASEFNVAFRPADAVRLQFGRVRDACARLGRDPETLIWSCALTVAVGRDDAEAARRAEATGEEPARLRAEGVAGTPDQAVGVIGRHAEAGCQRVYLQVMDLQDLAHLELIAERVMPQLS